MAKSRMKWLTMRKKTQPEYPYEPPIWLGALSNGEFYHEQTARKRRIRAEILRRCDDHARKLGMDRREFMASAMGMITALSVINMASGCGSKDGYKPNNEMYPWMSGRGPGFDTAAGGMGAAAQAAGGATGASTNTGTSTGAVMGSGAGGSASQPPTAVAAGSGGSGAAGSSGTGGFMVCKDAAVDEGMAGELVNHDYFVIDFQTHHVEGGSGPSFGGCDNIGSTADAYVRSIFEESDTTVAVLSGLPAEIGPNGDLQGFSNEQMQASRDRVNKAAMSPPYGERMLAHCQVSPKNDPQANLEMMTRAKTEHDTRGWKCYPPTQGGWFLNENMEFIQSAVDLGEPLVCVHKGFPFTGWSRVHADPMPDVGVVAKAFPNVNFVIYHSAFDGANPEAEYNDNPNSDSGGTNRLAKVVSSSGLTGMNVYAEMGAVWASLQDDPMQASHYIGKMLKYVGIERLVWGSECCWFGSPQCQIESMKLFTMDPAIRDQNDYPDFTDEVKRNMFGLTGSKLYRVDPCAKRLEVSLDQIAMNKQRLDEEVGPRRWALTNKPTITTRRQFLDLWKWRNDRGIIA
jgi:predicted TIM-barrel fold metal-dependent hydrolase